MLKLPICDGVESNIIYVDCRSDHKEVPDHNADSQQSGYSQREFLLFKFDPECLLKHLKFFYMT